MASLKKKITISAQKKQPKKKADDFTVNTLTGKRTLSGAEASRMQDQSLIGLKYGTVGKSINEPGRYSIGFKRTNLQVATGGKKNQFTAPIFVQEYQPSGKRTKRERGR